MLTGSTMKIEQMYTGCLAQGAYYLACGDEAAIVDPLREIKPYLERAESDGVRIKYIFETHFHADFVSGHLDLARATGATIVYGPTARPGFAAHIARDGEVFAIGNSTVRVLHTPGHTLESVCYLVRDEAGNDQALLTGDTLFIGDVGRPDLAQQGGRLTQEELAGMLYQSLREKIMPLGDHVLVYPAHGAGSACGKNMSKETVSTLGAQKKHNYALRADMTREEFVAEVLHGLQPPPAYFPQNVQLNKAGYEGIDQVLQRGLTPLSVEAFAEAAARTGILVLDTRKPEVFAQGFVPGAINIGLDGSFAPWVGALVPDLRQPLLLVTEPGREEETVTRLSRVGYDQAVGYLEGGFGAWQRTGRPVDAVPSVPVETFAARYREAAPVVVDVRKPSEFAAGHLPGAVNLPLDFLHENLEQFPRDQPVYVHCAGGYRSMITCSVLKARGWDNVTDVAGGFAAMTRAGLPVVQEETASAG
jgi:glyoxylase-like metal-dependent hydrolase (beta-lactamase superfamily II)/rhodanese-related sulfurtransferase